MRVMLNIVEMAGTPLPRYQPTLKKKKQKKRAYVSNKDSGGFAEFKFGCWERTSTEFVLKGEI